MSVEVERTFWGAELLIAPGCSQLSLASIEIYELLGNRWREELLPGESDIK